MFTCSDISDPTEESFDSLLRSAGLKPVKTPYQAPNANAFAERWIRSLREECLNHLIKTSSQVICFENVCTCCLFATTVPRYEFLYLTRYVTLKPPQKRQIADSVFSNLELDGVSLCAEYRLPFAILAENGTHPLNYARQDSNLRPTD